MTVKRYVISALVLTFVMLTGSNAFALDGYVGVKGIYGMGKMGAGDMYGTGAMRGTAEEKNTARMGGGGVAGIRFELSEMMSMRIEGEFLYGLEQSVSINSADISLQSSTALGNIYLDFKLAKHFIPYISVGGGVALNKMSYQDTDMTTLAPNNTNSTDIILQGGVGAYIPIGPFALDLNVRYVHSLAKDTTFDIYGTGVDIRDYYAPKGSIEGLVSILFFF